jgi:amidase
LSTASSDLPAFAGVEETADRIRAGTVTARVAIETTLDRIDAAQPHLNAFRVVFGVKARQDAKTADAAGAGPDRPLAGVPIAIKDNAAVAGESAMQGTGSPQPPAAHDDDLVARLRTAGAIPVGLTHLPELALWAATETRWHGITRNPWDLTLAPGGSSGGSAAAVAAGLVPVAHATDGLGSIRIPASACGLVGLKPTHGLVPLTGSDPDHWLGMSHAGFLTRSVRDQALVLDAVLPGSSYTASLADLPELRVAISDRPWTPLPLDPDVDAGLALTGAVIRDLGHHVEVRHPEHGTALSLSATTRYLAGMAQDRASLADPKAVESRTRRLALVGGRIPVAAQHWARRMGAGFGERMLRFFDQVDVLLTPTMPVLPVPAGELLRRNLAATMTLMLPCAAFTGPWNACGFPALSIPAAVTPHRVPVGMQLIGAPGSEARLLALAAAIESKIDWTARRPHLPWAEA